MFTLKRNLKRLQPLDRLRPLVVGRIRCRCVVTCSKYRKETTVILRRLDHEICCETGATVLCIENWAHIIAQYILCQKTWRIPRLWLRVFIIGITSTQLYSLLQNCRLHSQGRFSFEHDTIARETKKSDKNIFRHLVSQSFPFSSVQIPNNASHAKSAVLLETFLWNSAMKNCRNETAKRGSDDIDISKIFSFLGLPCSRGFSLTFQARPYVNRLLRNNEGLILFDLFRNYLCLLF